MQKSIEGVLRGVGQVMLQENKWTGLLFLVGLAYSSMYLAALALVATILATLFAYGMKYPRERIEQGLYGYNATLVGIGCGLYMEPCLLAVVLFVLLSILSAVVAHWGMRQKYLPVLTSPFVLLLWALLLFELFVDPPLQLHSFTYPSTSGDNLLSVFGIGLGQVMLQANYWTGLLFLLGLLVGSPRAVGYVVVGCLLTFLLCLAPFIDAGDAQSGLYLYNTVLVAIVVSGKPRRWAPWALLVGTILSFFIQYLGLSVGISTLTAPFVVVVWMLCGLEYLLRIRS
ncbi:urea transporter [uncultured Porphyromonas sp.]|uniref:urea transporter n=1 Tax=uncultured Porphyromonas sp. TaxID=159274 RepID=UPI002620316A|nr:urea transporter [uncultured Porphyromonas sp.]